jgi:hypothetical protein
MEHDDSGKAWIMCVQTAKPNAEPPNDVDIEVASQFVQNFK